MNHVWGAWDDGIHARVHARSWIMVTFALVFDRILDRVRKAFSALTAQSSMCRPLWLVGHLYRWFSQWFNTVCVVNGQPCPGVGKTALVVVAVQGASKPGGLTLVRRQSAKQPRWPGSRNALSIRDDLSSSSFPLLAPHISAPSDSRCTTLGPSDGAWVEKCRGSLVFVILRLF
jgi:hypothetical protein